MVLHLHIFIDLCNTYLCSKTPIDKCWSFTINTIYLIIVGKFISMSVLTHATNSTNTYDNKTNINVMPMGRFIFISGDTEASYENTFP